MAAEIIPICSIQKIVLYETKARYYLVGSNVSQTKFRVLKIDRTVPYLSIIDDKVEYDNDEIKQLLAMINDGNIPKNPKAYDKDSTGLHRTVSAFGIVGFIRFLEGYYIILISKREKVAQIGGNTIYKITDTCMFPIPNATVRAKYHHDGESKYLKAFQNVDLSSNFYFSYTYDLTQSLQYNMSLLKRSYFKCPSCECQCNLEGDTGHAKKTDTNFASKSECKQHSFTAPDLTQVKSEEESVNITNGSDMKARRTSNYINEDFSTKHGGDDTVETQEFQTKRDKSCHECARKRVLHHYTVSGRGKPCMKFVWNKHMLKDVDKILHSDWMLYITHGYIGQCNISVYGRPLYLTLIGRRSNEYAGTRFLKRGSNDSGYVANDVETEQILHDASTLSFKSGRYTSFVQIRGSVPLFWSQELQHGVVPKPQIQVDRSDPYAASASQHFNSVLGRFGSPIIVFNLVKKKERKRHEQILGEEFKGIVEYLNQFLPPQHKIKYIWFDIARSSKKLNKDFRVVKRLQRYAKKFVESVGFFHSGQDLYANEIRSDDKWLKVGGYRNIETSGRQQTGVIRVNCVDCLDRTNIAQFVIGKQVLGFQLYALGIIDKPVVNFDCDAVRLLEDLYEDHGDTLAFQYGGSQLVHRIDTYLKSAPWKSYSRDIYQTVRRYYSGAFTDTEKQQAINLFLGKFIPSENCLPLWDHPTDYYLHHIPIQHDSWSNENGKSYTKWFDDEVVASLPLPCQQVSNQTSINIFEESVALNKSNSDLFYDYYQPEELSGFKFLFSFHLPSSYRLFSPATKNDPSPFVVRATGGGSGNQHEAKRPSLQRATSPHSEEMSSDSDSTSSSDSDTSPSCKKVSYSNKEFETRPHILGRAALPNMKDYYGVAILEPSKMSEQIYQSFVAVNRYANKSEGATNHVHISWMERDEKNIRKQFDRSGELSNLSVSSALMYKTYIDNSRTGSYTISSKSMSKFEAFVRS
ncbi:polyphosphoinositide phosphatase-like [Dendronephthya gigantea]|uniref:polyphosphoinositide phosphatase-like n=1 Tax=Dendronephthya gigantea TaxID=151771 RepID=UPI00106D144D|nr:polyphosphoinositide phosphatase-like [Dendronephthya gigantea]